MPVRSGMRALPPLHDCREQLPGSNMITYSDRLLA